MRLVLSSRQHRAGVGGARGRLPDPQPRLAEAIGAMLPPALEDAVHRSAAALLPLVHGRVPLTVFSGRVAAGERECRVLYAGAHAAAGYWVSRIFGDAPRRDPIGHCRRAQLPARVAGLRDAVDLTLVRLDDVSARAFPADDYLVVPEWIGMRAPVPTSLRELAGTSDSLADDFRRVRRGRFACRISHAAADLELFYRAMYRPYVGARHGEEAVPQSRARVARAFRRGGLIMVAREGEAIAGLLFERHGDTLDAVAIGVREGDPVLLRSGVVVALYVELFRLALEQGLRWIDMRGTRPSLRDGLLRYKRKWGAMVAPKPDVRYVTCMQWRDLTGPAGDILARHPVIFRKGGQLHAFAAAGADAMRRPGDIRAARRDLWTAGLGVLCLATNAPAREMPATALLPLDRGCDPRAVHAAVDACVGAADAPRQPGA